MPGLIKIGKSKQPLLQRVGELSRASGVPIPFEVYYASTVDDCDFIETQLHRAFDHDRFNKKREFFRTPPENALAALLMVQKENVTPSNLIADTNEEEEALENAITREERFSFEKYQIPVGATLTFFRDETITCTYVGDSRVNYLGEVMSMNQATMKALERTIGRTYRVSAYHLWMYDGEILNERRLRMNDE